MSTRTFFFVVGSVFALTIAVLVMYDASSSDAFRRLFTAEDSLVENLSAAIFLFTFVLGVLSLKHRPISSRLQSLAFFFVMMLGLLGFLDEISFGERVFDLEMPYLAGEKLDAAHDLFDIGIATGANLERKAPLVFWVAFASVLIVLGILVLRHWAHAWRIVCEHRLDVPVFFLALVAAAIAFSVFLESAWAVSIPGNQALEELAELNASLFLLAAMVALLRLEPHEKQGARGR